MFLGSWKWDPDAYRIVFTSSTATFPLEKDISSDLSTASRWRCDRLTTAFGIKTLESFCRNFIGIFEGNLVKHEIVKAHLVTKLYIWILFQMRILDRISTQLTTLHKVLLDDLFKLATTVYTEVGPVTVQCFSLYNSNNNVYFCSLDLRISQVNFFQV